MHGLRVYFVWSMYVCMSPKPCYQYVVRPRLCFALSLSLTSSPNLLRKPTKRLSTQGTCSSGSLFLRIISTSGTPNT